MPFTDFAKNVKGGAFDLVHLKDWTFVDMKPLGQPFVFTNMYIRGGPPGCGDNPPAPSTSTGGDTPTVSIKTGSKAETSAASSILPSLITGVVVGLAPLAFFVLI